MIKPFTILSVRDEPDSGKTVFFRVRKTVQVTDTQSTTNTMESAIYVAADADINQEIYNSLQKAGWF